MGPPRPAVAFPGAKLTTRQDEYVSILGTLKTFSDKKHINATHIYPITNHNEVYNHLLKALYVSLALRNPGGAARGNVNGNGAGAGMNAVSGDYTAGTTIGSGDAAYAHLPPLQRKIIEYVVTDTSDEGVHVSTVSRAIGSNGAELTYVPVSSHPNAMYSRQRGYRATHDGRSAVFYPRRLSE